MTAALSLPSRTRHALVLGLLTAIGPFAIDMYLPALPAMARQLGIDAQAAQSSLGVFFVALGAGQLVAGPLSDRFGRRAPLRLGLLLFALASAGCAWAPDLPSLLACRLLQGLGACACMVTPRAVVRDLYTGPEAVRLMALLLTVYSVSPILAPLAGSLVADAAGWRAVFGAMAAVALVALAVTSRALPETRPPDARTAGGWRNAFTGYGVLLRDRSFLAVAAMASLTLSGFFIYVANSAFVFDRHFGVSPRRYALLFALNALALVAVSQWNGRLGAWLGLRRLLRIAATLHFAVMGGLAALCFAGVDRLDVLVTLLALGYGLNGLIVPTTFVLAMERHPQLAGTASALLGTMNFAGGAVVVALVAPWADGTPWPMVCGIAACSLAVALLAWRSPRCAPGR